MASSSGSVITPSGPQTCIICGTSASVAVPGPVAPPLACAVIASLLRVPACAIRARFANSRRRLGTRPMAHRPQSRGSMAPRGSGHALVGRDGQELGVVVGEGDLREQGHGLVVLGRVERGAVLLADQAEFLADEPLHQVPGHLLAL